MNLIEKCRWESFLFHQKLAWYNNRVSTTIICVVGGDINQVNLNFSFSHETKWNHIESLSESCSQHVYNHWSETNKSSIRTKNKLYKQYIDHGRFENDFEFEFETLITEFYDLVTSAKDLFHKKLAKKINIPVFQAKKFWSIIKNFPIKKFL